MQSGLIVEKYNSQFANRKTVVFTALNNPHPKAHYYPRFDRAGIYKRENMMVKLKCSYINGGGTEYDAGIWEKKETPKRITLNLIEEPFFDCNYTKIVISKTGGFTHAMRDYGDGSFTIYPEQCGTPYTFEPI